MRDQLVFYLNGTRQAVRGDAVGSTLSDFLRRGEGGERLCGTKIACAEGDCGACTVLVGRRNAAGDGFDYRTIDACIAFVYQLDRTHVVTVEGLAERAGANEPTDLSVVQQAMVDCHGSQCGFCTPGFVMAMHGVVEKKADGPLTDDDLRLGLSGNLCRCTGYSQILEAGHRCEPAAVGSVGDRFDSTAMLANFAELGEGTVHVNARPKPEDNGHADYPVEALLPSTLDELLRFRDERPDAKLVSGATDVGVQFNHGRIAPKTVLYTRGVSDLDEVAIVDNELRIGAAASWSRIEDFIETTIPEYHAILARFGSPQVRHTGTLAGNLANASPIADSIPFHYAAGSIIELASLDGRRDVPIEDFYQGYKQLDLRPNELIVGIRTPLPTAETCLKLYKVSKRRDMDISTVTAAFWLEADGGRIASARVAVGGVGPVVLRVPKAEAALAGGDFSLEAMQAAGRIARDEITPLTDVRGSADYRLQLVENLFAKCWHDLSPSPTAV